MTVLEATAYGLCSTTSNYDMNVGCAGIAFRIKTPIFESNTKLKSSLYNNYPIAVRNAIAIPIFDEDMNSIGVIEILNSEKAAFTQKLNALLQKCAKYISLLLHTSELFRVILMSYL